MSTFLLDAHYLGKKMAGMERYWKSLLVELKSIDKSDKFYVCTSYGLPFKSKNFKSYAPKIDSGFYRLLVDFPLTTKKVNADLIHVNFFAPLLKTTPIVVTVHDLAFFNNPELFSLPFRVLAQLMLRRTLKIADAIICPSEEIKRQIAESFRIKKSKIFLTNYGVDRVFKFLPDKKRIRNNLKRKFKISKNYFLVPGDLEKRGMPQLVLAALTEFYKIEKNYDLIFTGENKLQDRSYRELIGNGRVKVLGYVSDKDLIELYNCATAVLYLSECEGFGLPILEAMTCRAPVICSDTKVFRGVAGNSAFFVKNSQELYGAMLNAINKKIRDRYVKLGYKRRKLFSWNRMAQQTLNVYRWVLNHRNES